MLMTNICVYIYKVLTSSELVCASYDHIYVPIIMYCLRLFVVVLQELHCLQKKLICRCTSPDENPVNELCVCN